MSAEKLTTFNPNIPRASSTTSSRISAEKLTTFNCLQVTIEGDRGSGKSTLLAFLARALRERGVAIDVVDGDQRDQYEPGVHRMRVALPLGAVKLLGVEDYVTALATAPAGEG